MKTIYLIRHCSASGQEREAELTATGVEQSIKLADFLKNYPIDYIVSSPYVRAVQTITPFAKATKLEILTDDRLSERILSGSPNPDWMNMLERSFTDVELSYEGGESSKEAMMRGISVISQLLEREEQHLVAVTHGNLLALLLKYFDSEIGFVEWKSLSNPDVYTLTFHSEVPEINRIWN